MDKSRLLAILAAFAASAIYGVNHTIAKGLMPLYIEPFGFILLRVTGAAILFWIVSLFAPKEKIATSDWPRILGCAIFGMVINMLFFFKGLSLSTPINSSVIITLSPVMVLILASILTKELGNLDGIQKYDDDSFLVSAWNSGDIYKISKAGDVKSILKVEKSVGDILYVREKNMLALPMNFQNKLMIYSYE